VTTRVCVVGSGGREHALADVLGRSAEVVVTPGNAGIPGSTDAPPEEIDADLFVIGPEDPLVAGLADRLRAIGKRVFGPGADGAQLEGSKQWMKALLEEAGVLTARYAAFGADEIEQALAFLRSLHGLYVVKTDGLAAGKGVLVTENLIDAEDDVRAKLSGSAFGEAGLRVVIEEGMTGPELSILAVCDGRRAVPLPPAQDHKRIFDGDRGPNTGGMGAYSPVAAVDDALVDQVMAEAVEPTLDALVKRGIDYRGVLYAGLMLTPEGPKMLEYNCRFGDPEAQAVLPRLTCDLAGLLGEAADGDIETTPTSAGDAAVTVVLATERYPEGPYRTGDRIQGLDAAEAVEGVVVFHAGTARDAEGQLVTAGGRVLAVTALAPTLSEARRRAYDAVGHITWPGMQYRHDIATAASKEAAR